MKAPTTGRILVVDDTPANLSLLLDALTEAGHEILVAESGRSALSLLAHTTPDLVLLDFMMPGLDGIATCLALKQLPSARDVPVLFMTAVDEPEQKLRAFEAGALDYITKPVYPPEVLARVTAHLQIRTLQKSVEEELALRLEAEDQLSASLDRAVVVATPAGRILFCTRPATALLYRHFPAFAPGFVPAALLAATASADLATAAGQLNVRRFVEPGRDDLVILHLEEIVVATPAGRILFCTRPATALLYRHFPAFAPGFVPAALLAATVSADLATAAGQLNVRRFVEPGRDDLVILHLEEIVPVTPAALRVLGMTAREAEVLFWIAQGKSNPDIATILGLGVRTVHKHVEHIFEKLGCETRHAAALTAAEILRAK